MQMNGTPVNTKSLLAFVFNEMTKLAENKISPNEAIAQAKLASQACNILNYELKRTIVQISLNQIGKTSETRLREIESKAFDDTI